MKFRAPDLYSVLTQLTAHDTVSTSVTPGVCCPVRSVPTPTSLVPIHNVHNVSAGVRRPSEPFALAAKYAGSSSPNTDGKLRGVSAFEHVAPDLAKGKSEKRPSSAAKMGHRTPPSA